MKINKLVGLFALAQLILPWQFVLSVPASAATPPATRTGSASPASSVNLNLTSTQANLSAAKVAANNSLTIRVGGVSETVKTSSMLTPAEMAAAYQVEKTGYQTLVIGRRGNAVGGTLSVSDVLAQLLANLVVPQNVKVLDSVGLLNLSGDLTNSGKIIFLGSSPAVVNASGIYNYGSISSNGSLFLNVSGNIVNNGLISTSSGDLTLAANSITNNAGGLVEAANNLNLISGNITNAATMAALAGNLNINTVLPMDIMINNAGGTLAALQGDINVRNSAFSGQNNLSLSGGNALSQNLNLYSGSGSVDVNADKISGLVNVYAGQAQVTAATSNLLLGTMNVSGDPSFYNTAGAVTINGSLTFSGNALAIVAQTNITSSTTGSLNTSSTSADGGAITLIAGAAFTATPNDTSSSTTSSQGGGSGDTSNTLTITGGTRAGGYIDLTGGTGTGGGADPITLDSTSTSTTAGSQNGGNITLVAYGGTGSNAGTIDLPVTATAIQSGGNGAGTNGNVTMIAGATKSGTVALNIGGISAKGGTGGGVVSLNTATPKITGGNRRISILNGAIQSGSGTFTAGATQPTSVTTNNDITANQISINAGGNISWFNSINNFFGPYTIAISPSGTYAYVTNFGSNNFTPTGNTVSVVDLATNTVTATIKVGTMAAGVAFNPSGTLAYVTNYNDPSTAPSYVGVPGPGTVSVIDTATNQVINTIAVGQGPASVAFNPAGTFAYVANYISNTVSVINTATNTVTATIPVGYQPTCVQLNPAGTVAYVTNTSTSSTNPIGTVSVISTATNTVIKTISGFNTPYNVAFNPAGTFAYVTNSGAGAGQDTVSVISTTTNSITGTISGGGLNGPSGVAFNPSGTVAYVTNYGLPGVSILGNTVSIINTTTSTVVGSVAVGTGPVAVAFNLSGTTAYVADYKYGLANDGTLGIINASGEPAVLTAASGPVVLQAGTAGGGSIIAYTQTANLTANAAGDVTVLNFGDVTLSANNGLHNGAKGFYQLSTFPLNGNGSITIDDTLTALKNVANGIVGNIFLQSSEGATMGIGGIVEDAGGFLSTSALSLSDSSGAYSPGMGIDSIGSDSANIATNAATLVANTLGNVYITDSKAVTISAPSTGAIFQLTTQSANLSTAASLYGGPAGTIDGTTSVTLSTMTSGSISINGAVTSDGDITITSGRGNVALGADVTSGAAGVAIAANGAGTITQTTGSVNADTTLALSSGIGDIGSVKQSLSVDTPAVTATSSASVFVSDTDTAGVSLGTSSAAAAGQFQFVSCGDLTVGSVSGGTITLQTAPASGASMTLTGNVGTSTTNGVNLSTDGTGNISQSAGLVSATRLTLASGSGNLEGNNGNLLVSSRFMTVNTGGSAMITNQSTTALKLSNSAVDGLFQLLTAGPLSTGGTVASGIIEFATTGGNSGINIAGTLGQGDASIFLTASGSGNILTSGGNVVSDSLTLVSGSGTINVFTTSTAGIVSGVDANTTGKGAVTITNNGPLTIYNGSTSGGNFTVKTKGAGNALEVSGTITAGGSISLTAAGGAMVVNSGSSLTASNGNVLLNNSDSNAGTIEIQGGASIIATSTNGSLGNVTISVGSPNPARTNTTTPPNITPTITVGGQIYYGANSITSNNAGGNNLLTADARKITFSAPAQSAITLDGNTAITAQVLFADKEQINEANLVDTGDDGQNNDAAQVLVDAH